MYKATLDKIDLNIEDATILYILNGQGNSSIGAIDLAVTLGE